jgi:predicted nuclease of restriction endonuclease-like (RecB) superfamily
MKKESLQNTDSLFERISEILEIAQSRIYHTVNSEMLYAYWNVGREIIEEEQKGKDRAAYGSALLEELAKRMTKRYGRSFSSRNLRYMRQFYKEFPKWNAVRSELSWTHYRMLLKVEKHDARRFYMNEAISGNWSTRQLDRQINSLYLNRLLLSKDRKGLMLDNIKDKEPLQPNAIIKDPFVLEFLDITKNEKLTETGLESLLIEKLQHFILELGNGFSC